MRIFRCPFAILCLVDLCVPVCAPSRRTVAAVAAVFVFGRTGVHPSFTLQLSLLLSSVSYLFRLLRVKMIYIAVPLETAHGNLLCVCIAKDRAPGSTVRDGMTFRANRRMAESAHALMGCSV